MKTLTFRNPIQRELFIQEIIGQLSDGMWENASPDDHWIPWNEALVGSLNEFNTKVGRNFSVRKANYELCSSMLLDAVGDRMLKICHEFDSAFTMDQMKAELRDMKVIMKTQI